MSGDKVLVKFANHLFEETACCDEQVIAFGIPGAKFFGLTLGELETTLALKALPAKRGSKIIYSIEYPFAVDSSGTTTYDAAVIKAAKQRINDIAND